MIKNVDSFNSANVQQQFDEVVELLPQTVTDSNEINLRLIQYYGRRLMVIPHDSWNEAAMDNFQRSARILNEIFPELVYSHRMLIMYRRLGLDYDGQNAEIVVMILSLRSNNSEERGDVMPTTTSWPMPIRHVGLRRIHRIPRLLSRSHERSSKNTRPVSPPIWLPYLRHGNN